MRFAELTAQDAAVIIGACSAAFATVLGVLLKFLAEIRKTTNSVNAAVNNRPAHEPTLRVLVEQTADRVDRLADQHRAWHSGNVHRIDRLADAVGGINRRLDNLERRQQGDT